jgi:hypothetical protein
MDRFPKRFAVVEVVVDMTVVVVVEEMFVVDNLALGPSAAYEIIYNLVIVDSNAAMLENNLLVFDYLYVK